MFQCSIDWFMVFAMTKSGSYCPLPFHHIFINNAGYLNPCCLAYPQYADEEGQESLEKRNVLRHGIKQAFRSDYLDKVRKQMKESVWPAKCASCKKVEAMGLPSARLNNLSNYPDPVENPVITSLDLRLGNICNLKCRMCSPFSSAALKEEWALSPNSMMQRHSQHYRQLNWANWSEDPKIWDELQDLSVNVTTINLAGGEPFLNKVHVEFLRNLVARKISTQVSLSYNTNLSLIPSWLEEMIPHYKEVSIMVSVDGMGKLNEFIRHPSSWPVLTKNLDDLDRMMGRQSGKLKASLITTIQIYNVLYLDDLLNFLLQQDWQYLPKWPVANFLHNPDFLSASVLSSQAKQVAIQRLIARLEMCQNQNYPEVTLEKLSHFVREVVTFLQEGATSGKVEDFFSVSSFFDKSRHQDYFKLAPEMAEFVGQHS